MSPAKRVAEEAYKVVTGEIIQGRYNLRRDTKSPKFEEYAKVYLEYSKANKRSYEADITMFKGLYVLSLKDTSYQRLHLF